MIAPILCSISEQMLKLGGVSLPSSRSHHQLTESYTRQQNQRITSLLNVFEIHLNLSDEEVPFFNMITGQIFPDDVFNSIVSFEDIGEDLYRQFVNERLKPESESPLQKANLKTCKSTNKKKTMKIRDKVVELRKNCNLFARCALMQKQRNIDMKEVVGDHEVPRALFNVDGSLLDGTVKKSDAVTEILDNLHAHILENMPIQPKCAIIDSMRVVNEINQKTCIIKTGNDLADEFNRRIDTKSRGAGVVVVAFDLYDSQKPSLKGKTRAKRTGKKSKKFELVPPRDFKIEGETKIDKVSMIELLASEKNKKIIN